MPDLESQILTATEESLLKAAEDGFVRRHETEEQTIEWDYTAGLRVLQHLQGRQAQTGGARRRRSFASFGGG